MAASLSLLVMVLHKTLCASITLSLACVLTWLEVSYSLSVVPACLHTPLPPMHPPSLPPSHTHSYMHTLQVRLPACGWSVMPRAPGASTGLTHSALGWMSLTVRLLMSLRAAAAAVMLLWLLWILLLPLLEVEHHHCCCSFMTH